ncbi:unnamed protein product [Adineta ricciae]|uniref:BTB domain-containing protein n=1 Tax=Adineta ricciae TaxID=249248 RepID=A0A813UCW1_ADIRI|nr:unnamed protein product [Adineta ricciae]CAF1298822.1 unnamed protein product [Adineta ricciae]
MHLTTGTNSLNKKQANANLKRSRSINMHNIPSKYFKPTMKINAHEYFSQERPFANVKINFQQQIIWCDKALLAAASPILCEQLLKLSPKDEYLTLNDIQLDEFLLLLEFIYPLFNPEINEENISTLIQLSHRFQFVVLKQACQLYAMKYLNTIRHVFNKCQKSEAEGDSFVNNHIDENTNENDSLKKRDLIEFNDGTCIDAYNIVLNLCRWLNVYFYEDNFNISQSIVYILRQISIENLNRIMNMIAINDEIKVYAFKERAEYLENLHQVKHVA